MKKITCMLAVLWMTSSAVANNVVISNVSVINNGANNIFIQFDLSWENSWRVANGPANYDGVWVFFKYKTNTGNWTQVYLIPSGVDVMPAGFDFYRPATAPVSGVIIHRAASNLGTGTVSGTGFRLNVTNTLPYDIEVRGYAIEMVYIPQQLGELRFGDGDGATESTNAFHPAGSDNNHTRNNFLSNVDPNVNDDAEIESPNDFTINAPDGIGSVTITNNNFPTLSAMWCMKYELTQGAYRDFLNTLTLTQQTTRTFNAPTSATGTTAMYTGGTPARNHIEIRTPSVSGAPAVYGCDASGNNVYDEANDGEFVACGFLNWPDLAAWLDWAGLAPMTEIHFERICRGGTLAGPNIPQVGEFAWGTTDIVSSSYTLSLPFTANELASNASTTVGNASYSAFAPGPLRNGIFATATSNRITSGAAFYGVMEMSGGVTEACVSIGSVAGRSYNKLGTSRGNGAISANGNADAPHWPGNSNSSGTESLASGEVSFSVGVYRRGGDYSSSSNLLRVSDRSDGPMSLTRASFQGGRGVIVVAMY